MKIVLLLLFLFSCTHAFSENNYFEDWLEEEMISINHEQDHEESSIKSQLSGAWVLDKIGFRVRSLFELLWDENYKERPL